MKLNASIAAASILLAAIGAPAPAPAQTIPFPHPVIMEVLFDVPRGAEGDADKDGVRNAAGDEFIELINPHAEPIDLTGYVITDRLADDNRRQLRFEFPEFTLPPGEIVVVFNGSRRAEDAHLLTPGPVGSPNAAPAARNDHFHDAWVFSMQMPASGMFALANRADVVTLRAPDGQVVESIFWGEPNPPAPTDALRVVEVPANVRGSVQRLHVNSEFLEHRRIDGALFSPGRVPEPGTD